MFARGPRSVRRCEYGLVDRLYDPPSHEPLVDTPWDEGRVRAAAREIAADAEAAFDDEALCPILGDRAEGRSHPRPPEE